MGGNLTVVFVGAKRVVLEDREIPSPQQGELLVKTSCTLISTGTELTILEGKKLPGSVWARYGKYPFVAGYDNIGTVTNVGPEVDKNWIGKKVGSCRPHARYVTVAADDARLVPAEVPSDESASFFTIAEIVMNGVRRSGVRFGESVVIYGAGLLGQLTASFCLISGARPVIVVDIADKRLDLLPKDKAVLPVNPKRDDVKAVVEKATKGRMADLGFEVTGNPDLIPEQVLLLRKMGRFEILSSPWGKTTFDFHDLCNSRSITIIGAHNSSHPAFETSNNPWTKPRDCELFFDLLIDGVLDMEPLISHKEPYTKAVELYQMLMKDRSQAMGVILQWSE